jgi:hypothetical protein
MTQKHSIWIWNRIMYDKIVSSNTHLCAFLPLLYPIVQLYLTAREEGIHSVSRRKKENWKKVDTKRMRCRSRFQINVYWSRPVPNINAILSKASACRGEHSYSITCEVWKEHRWKGVNPLVPCTESHFLSLIYFPPSQRFSYCCAYSLA